MPDSKPIPIAERDPDQLLRPKQVEAETGLSWEAHVRAKPDAKIQIGLRAVAMKRRDAHRPITK